MKVLFMGTPELSVAVVRAIVNSPHTLVGVVTQADKPKGRGKALQESPVKTYAKQLGIPLLQPVRIKTEEAIRELKQLDADIYVVAAYGQILSREILSIPPKGCINVHTSLLPKYRGSAPIQWAIMEGEEETGVTVMQMDEGMDTGDILFTRKVRILPEDTGGTLYEKLAIEGAALLVTALDEIERGNVHPIRQNEEEATYARMLQKQSGYLRFDRSAEQIVRMIRGLDPWPGTYTFYEGKTLKIWKAEALAQKSELTPGTVVRTEKDAILVNTADGLLRIRELQLEGKKRMGAGDFLRGCKIQAGEKLG